MDIAKPSYEDKQYIRKVIELTNKFIAEDTDPRAALESDAKKKSLSKILNTLQKEGSGTDGFFEDRRTFGITKQLRKIIYTEPEFHH
jgi:hypothetical protein